MVRIAVCDDSAAELRAISSLADEYLSSRGVAGTVRSFDHPDALLCQSESEGFHIYLLDMVMPMLSGLELGRAIRRRVCPGVRQAVRRRPGRLHQLPSGGGRMMELYDILRSLVTNAFLVTLLFTLARPKCRPRTEYLVLALIVLTDFAANLYFYSRGDYTMLAKTDIVFFLLAGVASKPLFREKTMPARRRSRPRSGRCSFGTLSHFGPPTAERSTLSEAKQVSSEEPGSGSPNLSIASPPIGASVYLNV